VMTYVLLFLAFGSVLLPLKAIAMNLLSLSATFGVLVWIFQDGHLHHLLGFDPTGNIEPNMPIMLFALIFGLSMDYEVFLVSRMREQYDQLGDSTAAVATGLQSIGRLVVSAALLMCVPLAAIGMSGVLTMKLFGVGMVFAVLTDVLLVRILLGTAVMKLLGRAAWWAPGPLGPLLHAVRHQGDRRADGSQEAGPRRGLKPGQRPEAPCPPRHFGPPSRPASPWRSVPVNPGDAELSTRLPGLVDVGVIQAELKLEAKVPDRVVEPLRHGVGGEVQAEDGRCGNVLDAGEGARQAFDVHGDGVASERGRGAGPSVDVLDLRADGYRHLQVTDRDIRCGELEYPLGSGGRVHGHHAVEDEVVQFEAAALHLPRLGGESAGTLVLGGVEITDVAGAGGSPGGLRPGRRLGGPVAGCR
jgi:hypothetical protein